MWSFAKVRNSSQLACTMIVFLGVSTRSLDYECVTFYELQKNSSYDRCKQWCCVEFIEQVKSSFSLFASSSCQLSHSFLVEMSEHKANCVTKSAIFISTDRSNQYVCVFIPPPHSLAWCGSAHPQFNKIVCIFLQS